MLDVSFILLNDSSINFLLSGLVRGTTKFNHNLTKSNVIILVSSSCHIMVCLGCMCILFLFNILLFTFINYNSNFIITMHRHDDGDLVPKRISTQRFLNHLNSGLSFYKVINLAIIVDQVIQICL